MFLSSVFFTDSPVVTHYQHEIVACFNALSQFCAECQHTTSFITASGFTRQHRRPTVFCSNQRGAHVKLTNSTPGGVTFEQKPMRRSQPGHTHLFQTNPAYPVSGKIRCINNHWWQNSVPKVPHCKNTSVQCATNKYVSIINIISLCQCFTVRSYFSTLVY